MADDRWTADAEQRRIRLSAYLESVAWADIEWSIQDVDTALRLALEATRDWLRRWEEATDDPRYEREFSLTPHEIESLSDEWRQAYVGRLVYSLALHYDLGSMCEPGTVRIACDVGGVMRELNRIAHNRA